MKFALIELKIALVKIIRNFEIKPGQKAADKLELFENFLRLPKNGVYVIFEKRK